jgi:hypothetical protein
MTISELIQKCVSEKRLCNWQDAANVTGVGKFMPSKIPAITKAFDETVKGSDALIVNSAGNYGRPELPERHAAFLKANGFTTVPKFVAKAAKVSSLTGSAPSTPANTEIAELRAMVLALTQLLAK